MSERARFTLQLTLRDNRGYEQPIHMAIDVDKALRISSRAVDELKMGVDLGFSMVSQSVAITMMRTKQMRRDIFKQLAVQLAGKMADRMEDAEGWHDASRIEAARKELGGSWHE